jgi:hypothetical protein
MLGATAATLYLWNQKERELAALKYRDVTYPYPSRPDCYAMTDAECGLAESRYSSDLNKAVTYLKSISYQDPTAPSDAITPTNFVEPPVYETREYGLPLIKELQGKLPNEAAYVDLARSIFYDRFNQAATGLDYFAWSKANPVDAVVLVNRTHGDLAQDVLPGTETEAAFIRKYINRTAPMLILAKTVAPYTFQLQNKGEPGWGEYDYATVESGIINNSVAEWQKMGDQLFRLDWQLLLQAFLIKQKRRFKEIPAKYYDDFIENYGPDLTEQEVICVQNVYFPVANQSEAELKYYVDCMMNAITRIHALRAGDSYVSPVYDSPPQPLPTGDSSGASRSPESTMTATPLPQEPEQTGFDTVAPSPTPPPSATMPDGSIVVPGGNVFDPGSMPPILPGELPMAPGETDQPSAQPVTPEAKSFLQQHWMKAAYGILIYLILSDGKGRHSQ